MDKPTTETVWQGASWRLKAYQQPLANGRFETKGYIEHPGAVALVPLMAIEPEPTVIMLRQYRVALDDTILELPAGTRGWEEDWFACGQRELREETGYRAGQLIPLGRIWPAPGLSDELLAIYLALDLVPDPLPADEDEEIELVTMPLATLVAMAIDGRLQDAKSVVAILRTADYMNRHS